MTDSEPTDGGKNPDEVPDDPRNDEVHGDVGMPAEFIDTPGNRPGDQSPPNPATVGEPDDAEA